MKLPSKIVFYKLLNGFKISTGTIKNYFWKFGFDQNDDEKVLDDGFKVLLDELSVPSKTAEEYIDFDIDVLTCQYAPLVNADEVYWRVSSVKKCVKEYLQEESEIDETHESDREESEDEVE